MNTRLPRNLAFSLSAIVLIVAAYFAYRDTHAGGMLSSSLILTIYAAVAAIAVVIVFSLGWLLGSLVVYVQARRAGLSGKDIPINRVTLVLPFLVVSFAVLTASWFMYKSHLEGMIYNPSTSAAELDALSSNYVVNRYPYLKTALAWNPSISSTTLAKLYNDQNEYVRSAVCRNPNVGKNILIRCATETNTNVLYAVAGNPKATQPILDLLSYSDDDLLRASVGRNSATGEPTLARLSQDKDADVRASILLNPQLSADILTRLASDADKVVRQRVAINPNTPLPVLLTLAKDPDENVRWALLRINTPLPVFDVLINDPSKRIRPMAKRLRDEKLRLNRQ